MSQFFDRENYSKSALLHKILKLCATHKFFHKILSAAQLFPHILFIIQITYQLFFVTELVKSFHIVSLILYRPHNNIHLQENYLVPAKLNMYIYVSMYVYMCMHLSVALWAGTIPRH